MIPRPAVLVGTDEKLLGEMLGRGLNIHLIVADDSSGPCVPSVHGIPYVVMQQGKVDDDSYSANLALELIGRRITHLVLAGFRPKLGTEIIRAFGARIIREETAEAVYERLMRDYLPTDERRYPSSPGA